jgi:gamma-glutamyltranspeptidase
MNQWLILLAMQHSGIGGGGFMLVRGSDGSYESIGELLFSLA